MPKPRYSATVAGHRSGLEDLIAADLKARGVVFGYESLKLRYTIPATQHIYTPDFILRHQGIVIESKGRFLIDDRKKHLYIQQQYPDLDIRFVFSSAKTKIATGAKMTVSEWADRHGFKWAVKAIPVGWLSEVNPVSRAQIEALINKE